MNTHIIDSYQIPFILSQNKTKSKIHIKNWKKFKLFSNMDPVSIVEDTKWTQFHPQTDGQTDGGMDKVKPVYPLSTSLKQGYNSWLDIIIEPPLTHNHQKHWYFRFNDDNPMSYKYILSPKFERVSWNHRSPTYYKKRYSYGDMS